MQDHVPHKQMSHIVTSRVLEMIHMDLMQPMQTESFEGEYVLVCVDDFSLYTQVKFLHDKSETFANQRPLEHFKNYVFNFRMRTLLIYVDVLIFIISSQTP